MAQVKRGTKLPPLSRGPMVGKGSQKQPHQNEAEEDEQQHTYVEKQPNSGEGIDFYASYVSEAIKHMQLKQLDIAIERLDSASKMRPKDPKSKLLKARCLIRQSKLKMALNVINKVLDENADNYEASEMRGEVLYHTGQFEQAIVQYQQAKSMRPKRKALRDGIDNCEQAMRNAIGQKGDTRRESGLDMQEPENSREREFFENKESGVVKDITERGGPGGRPASGAPGDGSPGPGKKKKNNHSVLLGDFYQDYVFLQGLLDRQIVTNKDTSLGSQVAPIVEQALKYLDTRAEFWQRQQPLYRRDQSGAYKVADDRGKKEKGGVAPNTDSKLQFRNAMLRVSQLFEEGKDEEAFDLAEETLQLVQDAEDDEINPAEKILFLGELFSVCGVAQQKMGNNAKARDFFHKDKKLSFEHNVEDGKYRSLDNLTSNYIASGDFNNALHSLMQRMKLTENKYRENPGDPGLEGDLAWLHHELARTYMQEKQNNKALEHGQASVQFAQSCSDDSWIIQGNFVTGEVYLQKGDMDRARDHFLAAQDIIREIDDQEGEFTAIDKKISAYLDQMDKLASGDVTSVSVIHSTDDVEASDGGRSGRTPKSVGGMSRTSEMKSTTPSFVRTDLGPNRSRGGSSNASSRGAPGGRGQGRGRGRGSRPYNKSVPTYASSGASTSPATSPWRGQSVGKRGRGKSPPGMRGGRGRGQGRGGVGTKEKPLKPLRPKRPKRSKSKGGAKSTKTGASDSGGYSESPPKTTDDRSYGSSKLRPVQQTGTVEDVEDTYANMPPESITGTSKRSNKFSRKKTRSSSLMEDPDEDYYEGDYREEDEAEIYEDDPDYYYEGDDVIQDDPEGKYEDEAEYDDAIEDEGEHDGVMDDEEFEDDGAFEDERKPEDGGEIHDEISKDEQQDGGQKGSKADKNMEKESNEEDPPAEEETCDKDVPDDYEDDSRSKVEDDLGQDVAKEEEEGENMNGDEELDVDGGGASQAEKEEEEEDEGEEQEERGEGEGEPEDVLKPEGDEDEEEVNQSVPDYADPDKKNSAVSKGEMKDDLKSASASAGASGASASDDKERTPTAQDWHSNLTPDDMGSDEEEDEETRMQSINDALYKFDDKDDNTKVTIDPNNDDPTVVQSSGNDQKSNRKVRSMRSSERAELIAKANEDGIEKGEDTKESELEDIEEGRESDVPGSSKRESDVEAQLTASKGQHSTPRESIKIAKASQPQSEVSGSLQEEDESVSAVEPEEGQRSEFADQEEEELQEPTLQGTRSELKSGSQNGSTLHSGVDDGLSGAASKTVEEQTEDEVGGFEGETKSEEGVGSAEPGVDESQSQEDQGQVTQVSMGDHSMSRESGAEKDESEQIEGSEQLGKESEQLDQQSEQEDQDEVTKLHADEDDDLASQQAYQSKMAQDDLDGAPSEAAGSEEDPNKSKKIKISLADEEDGWETRSVVMSGSTESSSTSSKRKGAK